MDGVLIVFHCFSLCALPFLIVFLQQLQVLIVFIVFTVFLGTRPGSNMVAGGWLGAGGCKESACTNCTSFLWVGLPTSSKEVPHAHQVCHGGEERVEREPPLPAAFPLPPSSHTPRNPPSTPDGA